MNNIFDVPEKCADCGAELHFPVGFQAWLAFYGFSCLLTFGVGIMAGVMAVMVGAV